MNWLENTIENYNIALSFIVLLATLLVIYMLIRCIKRPKVLTVIAFCFQLFVLTFGILSIMNKVISVPLYEALIIAFGILVPGAFLLYDYISMKQKIKMNNVDMPLIEKIRKPNHLAWQYESYLEMVDEWNSEINTAAVINSLTLEDKQVRNNLVQQLTSVHRLIDNGEYQQALPIYTILGELFSGSPLVLYNIALLSYRNELYDESIKHYKNALSLLENMPDEDKKRIQGKGKYRIKALMHFGYASALYCLKSYLFAIEQFTLAKEEQGELKEADVNIAKCYIAVGEIKEAQKHIREALEYKEDNKLRYILSRLCFEQNEEMECKHQLETIVGNDYEFDEAWELLGELYRRRKDWPNVLRVYKKLTKLNPDQAEAYYWLAIAQRHEGKTEEALSNLKFTVELMPEHSRALYSMASIFDAKGKTDKAVECLGKSLEGNEKLEMAYNLLAEIFISTDKVYDAIRIYEEAVAAYPESYLLHYNLGISLMMVRRYEESVRIFNRAHKLTHDDPALYYNWASAEISLKNYSEAAALYKEGLKLKSDDDEILFGLARVSALSGDVDATIGFLNQAFAINPGLKMRAKASNDFSAFRTLPEFMEITKLPVKEE